MQLMDGMAVTRWEGDTVATLLSRFYDRSTPDATVVLYNSPLVRTPCNCQRERFCLPVP